MRRYVLARLSLLLLVSAWLCGVAAADQLVGFSEITTGTVDGNNCCTSLTFDGKTYVVADGDLATGTTTRWYIIDNVEHLWPDGDPVPAGTPTTNTSTPKEGDQGWKADNYTLNIGGGNDICSLDGINFLQTEFPFTTTMIFILERGGNDTGTVQAIRPDGSLGPAFSISPGNPFGDTGVSVNGQNAYGLVLITDTPVKGVRVTAGGFDAFTICSPNQSLPTQAHNPNPEDGETGVVVAGATMSWTPGVDPADPNVQNPAITGHNLWISVPYDLANPPDSPNWQDPGIQIIELAADVNHYSPVLQKDKIYYWIVDESVGAAHVRDWANIIMGNVWSFETEKTGPVVDAGDSVLTWLENGSATIDLNGSVVDSTGDVAMTLWSVETTPIGATAQIANASVLSTTVTVDTEGTYYVKLYARDATMLEDEDTIEIKVYANSCEAARNNPEGFTAPLYDLNNDCVENFLDFAIFAERWLEDSRLAAPVLYDGGDISIPYLEITVPTEGAVLSGVLTMNAIAYDPAIGTTDGDGMDDGAGPAGVLFQMFDSSGTLIDQQVENTEPYDWADWDSTTGDYPNGAYKLRVTATSVAGYSIVKEISVTVSN